MREETQSRGDRMGKGEQKWGICSRQRMSRCVIMMYKNETEGSNKRRRVSLFCWTHLIIWLWVSPGHHVLLACQDPCSLCLPSDQQPSHPLVLCAGSSLCESVYFRVCDSHFLCSANEAKLYGTAGPPFILNSLFLFLFLSLSLSRVALLIGLAWVLRNAGACLNGFYSGIHLQMQHSGTTAEAGKFT